ncbi:MAG TPA: hypothetical protein VN634_19885 [Candidatus Limnocylindrales bacterium]|nr:hypothetical protein [Candidatus Limnocylindrales bacterium]
MMQARSSMRTGGHAPVGVLLIAAALAISSAACSFSWGSGGISDVSLAGRKPGELGKKEEPKPGEKAATNADAAVEEGRSLRKIAILPVAYSDGTGGLPCDVCPPSVQMKPTSAHAARLATGFTYEAIARHPRLLFPPPAVMDQAMSAGSMRAAVSSLYASGKAEFVVAEALIELRPRIGPDNGPEKPAGVTLYASLIDAKDGKILWSDTFDDDEGGRNVALRAYDKIMNDKPVRWKTAEGYTEHAVDELIEDLVDELD